MRLRLVPKPFDDPDYIFELKRDGFRARIIKLQPDGRPVPIHERLRPVWASGCFRKCPAFRHSNFTWDAGVAQGQFAPGTPPNPIKFV